MANVDKQNQSNELSSTVEDTFNDKDSNKRPKFQLKISIPLDKLGGYIPRPVYTRITPNRVKNLHYESNSPSSLCNENKMDVTDDHYDSVAAENEEGKFDVEDKEEKKNDDDDSPTVEETYEVTTTKQLLSPEKRNGVCENI
uniref:Uncharacterized protein n=1 Tax=Vespula pensylvanica TaxID=30213 RepID=A0A834K0K4_VESPE|nr:hypothetical protein H0235_016644 [Vespula pensylvanica]